MTTAQPQRPPHKILFILDGIVEEIIWTPPRMASIMLSEPVIYDATELPEEAVSVGYLFDASTNTFVAPEESGEENVE